MHPAMHEDATSNRCLYNILKAHYSLFIQSLSCLNHSWWTQYRQLCNFILKLVPIWRIFIYASSNDSHSTKWREVCSTVGVFADNLKECSYSRARSYYDSGLYGQQPVNILSVIFLNTVNAVCYTHTDISDSLIFGIEYFDYGKLRMSYSQKLCTFLHNFITHRWTIWVVWSASV